MTPFGVQPKGLVVYHSTSQASAAAIMAGGFHHKAGTVSLMWVSTTRITPDMQFLRDASACIRIAVPDDVTLALYQIGNLPPQRRPGRNGFRSKLQAMGVPPAPSNREFFAIPSEILNGWRRELLPWPP